MKDKSVTIRDVAAAAGVSTATVSRTLDPDGAGGVSEKTRLRVFEAAAGMGYRANPAARSLKTRSARAVAVVAPELANNFFMDLADGIERELSARGYTLLVASSDNSVEEEKKRVAMLADRMVDGIVVIPAGVRGDHLTALDRNGIPVVLVDRLIEGAGIDAILSDNETGARELTRRLLEDGFRRIVFVGGDKAISSARDRIAGFKAAMGEAGLHTGRDSLCLGGMGVNDGFRHMDAILKSDRLPEALVAVNLLVHLGMERRLLARLPRRRGEGYMPVIAAFDESDYSPFLPACRYTAAQDAAAIGKEAVQRILERIGQKRGGADAAEVTGPKIIRLPVMIMRHFQDR
ncbi:MAG: LacI family transcriptional regulator [Treponema sp.]|jgi:LacI family transcriptional regulator|nr:LacI family transcriptional regulator [Treponema sp.]